ncbi:MAG TPA: N-acetyltransferase [Rhizomicrobium sp.]|jgi:putative acetyltransferase
MIRVARSDDETAVASAVEEAFGRPNEARLVGQLRAGGDVVISLVAIADEKIVGHVMLSRMAAPFRALGLAPVSVVPDYQRHGIGHALIREGLKQAKEQGWDAVFVLGDRAYYERFGFRANLAKGFSSPYAGPHFMALSLRAALPSSSGRVEYAPAFASLG